MRNRTAVAIVPIFDPGQRLAGGEVLHLGAAAELSRATNLEHRSAGLRLVPLGNRSMPGTCTASHEGLGVRL